MPLHLTLLLTSELMQRSHRTHENRITELQRPSFYRYFPLQQNSAEVSVNFTDNSQVINTDLGVLLVYVSAAPKVLAVQDLLAPDGNIVCDVC